MHNFSDCRVLFCCTLFCFLPYFTSRWTNPSHTTMLTLQSWATLAIYWLFAVLKHKYLPITVHNEKIASTSYRRACNYKGESRVYEAVKAVESIKYLGIYVDSSLAGCLAGNEIHLQLRKSVTVICFLRNMRQEMCHDTFISVFPMGKRDVVGITFATEIYT